MTDTSNNPLKVAAFYKFVALDKLEELQVAIKNFLDARSINGMVLIAPEGINSTIAGEGAAIDEFITYLQTGNIFGGAFRDLAPKYSSANSMPFLRCRVRLKKEIVTLRASGVDPTREVGTYVEPSDWNALIAREDVILVDTRNNYETVIGTFEGAIDPETDHFTEFKDFTRNNLDPVKNKKVAMFCTGGIRCEKASAYLLAEGFEEVFHLEGGILKYLEEVPEEDSQWRGSCFVFDERVGVEHGLKLTNHTLCRACRWPLSDDDRAHTDYIENIQCARCKDSFDDAKRNTVIERQRQMELAKSRGEAHMGDAGRQSALDRRAAKLKQKERERAATKARIAHGAG